MLFFTLLTLSVVLLGALTNGAPNPRRASSIRAAPYFMPFENSPQPIDEILNQSQLKHFIFSFVLATNDGECVPTWDGKRSQSVADDQHVLGQIKKIRASGGDISVSFGGYNGVELGHVCRTPQELANAYQMVIDKYELTNVDFDIEGDDLGRVDEEYRRFEAINILRRNAQRNGKVLFVTLTMPSTIVGLSELGRAEIRRAIELHCDIDLYKIMAFDYGGTADYQAESVRLLMEHVHEQIRELRTDLDDEGVYASTGIILMNGHTDQATELYTKQVFVDLVEYAKDKGLGRVSFWALNRDRPCHQQTGWASGVCSSVEQKPYEFSHIIAPFQDHKPVHHHRTTVRPTTTTTPRPEPTTPMSQYPHHPDNPPTSDPINNHDEDCSKDTNSFYPYKGDCHLYIHCYEGKVHLEQCPPGTLYDNVLHLCNFEHTVQRPECTH